MKLFGGCSGCGALEAAVRSLRTQLADERDHAIRLQERHVEERKELLDRIMALSNPPALREARRTPQTEAGPSQSASVRPHFPGFRPDTRPPVDGERLAKVLRVGQGRAAQAQQEAQRSPERLQSLDEAAAAVRKLTGGD